MIELPIRNARWPKFRLLTSGTWAGTTVSTGSWKIEAMQQQGPRSSGFILESYSRALLPQLGTAKIIFRYGMFSGKLVGGSAKTNTRMRQGEKYTPGTDSMEIPDLTNKEIRIQIGYPDEDGNVSTWKTVWWGNCEYQLDEGWAGAAIPSGQRVYHCIDAFARTRRWFLDRHGFKNGQNQIYPAAGHPGYNVSRQGSTQVAGNKETTGATWEPANDGQTARFFTLPGTGSTWTDLEVAESVLRGHRPQAEPLWLPSGLATSQYGTASPWPVRKGDTVFDLICRIYNRARGRGSVLPDWTEEGGATGPLTCKLSVFPQTYQTIEYNEPEGSGQSIIGAKDCGTALDIDLIGDHRVIDGSLSLGDAQQYQVDYLVSEGEQIEVCGTVDYKGTLEKGWSDSEQSTFLGLDPSKRVSGRWAPLYQLHRLKRSFNMELGNGNGSNSLGDYRCSDAGLITTDNSDASVGSTALTMLEVMDDLPLYDGYKYDAKDPVREDGQTASGYDGTPTRRGPFLLFRSEDKDKYTDPESLSYGFQMRIHPDGFWITAKDDQATGYRQFGDGDSSLNQDRRYDGLVMTLGFRLPHRVRLATGKPEGKRRMVITYPDIHLWIAHPGGIWKLDDTDDSDAPAYPPKRFGAQRTLRDDRAALARLHATARAWYMSHLNNNGEAKLKHRNAAWKIRTCCDIPTSTDYDGGSIVYPKLGYVLHLLKANGEHIECNSVISSMSYDNTDGTHSIVTDWQDLDLRN